MQFKNNNLKLKNCIWCRKDELTTTFKKLAHTIPQSLGGQYICLNVCDSCNEMFGNHFEGLPSVETILKETFNISRVKFLDTEQNIGKNKPLPKFSSIYFDVDLKKHKISLKIAYRFKVGFQEKICRQLKKGLYKVFLEETERQKGNAHSPEFDFMREFARYNMGEYPVFYFRRVSKWIGMPKIAAVRPEIYLDNGFQMFYLVQEPSFFEFEFLGHVFGIATSRYWYLVFDNYIKKSMEVKKGHFETWHDITQFNEIDLTLSTLSE